MVAFYAYGAVAAKQLNQARQPCIAGMLRASSGRRIAARPHSTTCSHPGILRETGMDHSYCKLMDKMNIHETIL